MKQVKAQDGICFVIISAFDQVYFLEADKLFYFWTEKKKTAENQFEKMSWKKQLIRFLLDTHPELIILVLLNSFIFRHHLVRKVD